MGNNDLKQYIRSIMESKQPGLHVLQLPTGYGISYIVTIATDRLIVRLLNVNKL